MEIVFDHHYHCGGCKSTYLGTHREAPTDMACVYCGMTNHPVATEEADAHDVSVAARLERSQRPNQLDAVASAAVLVSTAYRLRDSEALAVTLPKLAEAVTALERATQSTDDAGS